MQYRIGQPFLFLSITLALTGLLTGCRQEASTAGAYSLVQSVEPYVVEGNPRCSDLGLGSFSIKIDPPNSGTYALDGANSVTVTTTDGIYFDWSATMGIDAVIAKGGPRANVYVYDPEAQSDTGLHAPINPNNEQPYGLSHIDFCYDYEVVVTKTAQTAFKRTNTWSIDKTGSATALELTANQIYALSYDVTVSIASSVDSDWSVSGEITVHNPAPVEATVTGVTDVIDDSIEASVDCGTDFPVVLGANGSLVCTYSSSLSDASTRLNVATADTTGLVGPGSGSAIVDFATATIDGVDDCVNVTDDHYGVLGEVCVGDAPKTYTYSLNIGPFEECGSEHTFVNTASATTNDSETGLSDSWTVAITVAPCETGCTLTQGYWKTHSSYGPAPYDETWATLPSGADTTFFLSGASYYSVLHTEPLGNGYYILAHQYIAAQLNGAAGATMDSVQATFDSATSLFSLYTPDQVAADASLSASFITLATVLDDFNNGLIGPGHCSE